MHLAGWLVGSHQIDLGSTAAQVCSRGVVLQLILTFSLPDCLHIMINKAY